MIVKKKFSGGLAQGVIFLLLMLAGCSHTQSLVVPENNLEEIPAPKSLTEVLQPDEGPHTSLKVQNGELLVQGIKLKNTQFDIPIAVNSRVEYWVDYFCGRGRKYFAKYLERSEFFIPYIAPILKQNGMPEDLVYLAMIESGFNNLARSHAKAVGPWQFMPATGKRYGLPVNWWIDERRDIQKSTLAAVGYLRDLYGIFGNWELASAAYNAGEAKVARAVRRFGTRDFWVVSKQRFLKPETRNYVPKMMAAAIIAKNREQFGFAKQELKPGAGEAVAGDGEVVTLVQNDKPSEDKEYQSQKAADLERLLAQSDEVLEEIDDENISSNLKTKFQASRQSPKPLAKPIPIPHITKQGEVSGEQLEEFEVQSPADLLKIARASSLSYHTVKSLNPEVLRWCTPPTSKRYRIKLPAFVKEKFLATYNHEAFPREVKFMTYKVRNGDTLARIAHHFGIRVDPMSDLNGVSSKKTLLKGSQVLLPMPNDRSRTFASLEVRDPPERRRHIRVKSHRVSRKRAHLRPRSASSVQNKQNSSVFTPNKV